MAGLRAGKAGFAKEQQDKMNAKYDETLAKEALEWVNRRITASGQASIDTSGSTDNVHKTLEDGTVLCNLMNAIRQGSIKKINTSKMAFKKMENINFFLTACEAYGVGKMELFQTVDLYESQNLAQVVSTIHALGRKVNTNEGHGGIGPKEAERNSREWTDEQLKAGQNVIGLQMGTNKGASQAGQSFGKNRMILD